MTSDNSNKWWDEHGGMHPFGENSIMFALEYHILVHDSDSVWRLLYTNMASNNGELRDKPYSDNPKVSHDNYTMACCAAKWFDMEFVLSKLKIFSKYRMHPRDIAFYFYCKHPVIGYPFIWITSLAMIISCARVWKVRPGFKAYSTDGKILALFRCIACDMELTYKICTWFLKRQPELTTWKKVIDYYFKADLYPDHPIVQYFKGEV